MKRSFEKSKSIDIPQSSVPKPYTGSVPPFSRLIHPDRQNAWDKVMQLVEDGIGEFGDREACLEETTSEVRHRQKNEDGELRYPMKLPQETEKYTWEIGQNPRINPRDGEDIPLTLLAIPRQSMDTPMENDNF